MATAWTRDKWAEECGGFDSEEYLVAAIKRHLLTEDQRRRLYDLRLSIEDLLNGRVEGDQGIYDEVFDVWNAALGWKAFG